MMRSFLARSLAVAVLAAASLSSLHAQMFTGKAKAVADADKAWSVAGHALDLDKLMSFFAPDAVVMAANAPVATTHEQMAAVYKTVLSIPGVDFSWHAQHVDVAASGDMAFSDGTYSIRYKGADGKEVEDKGKYITIWRLNKAGEWKVIRDIFNSDLPAPGQ